jgi:hypothetical protein
MTALPITRVVLYKHGVGYFEREGPVEGDVALTLTFKQDEVSDVLKSLTVLDLHGGHIASVSYDSTKPLEELLAEVALSIPDRGSLVGLLPQIKGARVAVQEGAGGQRCEGILLGVDASRRRTADGVVAVVLVSLLADGGEVRSFDLHALARLELLDPALRRDLDYYLRTQLSAKKKDARAFTFFAQGRGRRTVRLSYTVGAPVWKATYRILLGEEGQPARVQGWAVVDNTQDEDWENVNLSLVAGLPVSFLHDLYTPRYVRRPVVAVQETTGVLPPQVEGGMVLAGVGGPDRVLAASADLEWSAQAEEGSEDEDFGDAQTRGKVAAMAPAAPRKARGGGGGYGGAVSSMPAQVRERKVGDLFHYEIEHPVTIRRNQSALVPIVLRAFEGRPVLLHNRETRPQNPMRCVEFRNTTGLTLEGGPVTVLEGGSYVGEAMLDTLKPDEERLVPYAVELGVRVLDNVDSHEQGVHRVVLRDGRLTTYTLRVQQTTYTFQNKGEVEQTVYLDHPRRGEWELLDTQAPHETTENYWRFRFTLPARAVTPFVVRQRLTLGRAQVVANVTASQLGYWVEQRYLDAATQAVLRKVLEAQGEAADLEARLRLLGQERERIHAEQERIRHNLQALGDRPAEKELRERLVRTLNGQEDRLEQIAAEVETCASARDRCREQVNALLAGLEYEASV